MVHHVCGSHEWAGGRCEHSSVLDDKEPDGNKKYLNPESEAAEALRKIVFDTRWLKSLDYYICNRHTGQLEVHCTCIVCCLCIVHVPFLLVDRFYIAL